MEGVEGNSLTKIVVISGPTGVGKSALAIDLALRFDGEIINADCMQVYKGLNIGTAKPSPNEMKRVPHHLFDIVDPDQPFNAGSFKGLADRKINEIKARGKLPIIVGGTGLYIKALLKGLIDLDEELKTDIRDQLREKDTKALYDELLMLDPSSAQKIHPNDRVRLIRALELYYLTGKRPSELREAHNFSAKRYNALCIFIYTDRKLLYERIDRRCEEMIRAGLVEEVKALLNTYPQHLKPFGSIGYRHIKVHILNNIPLDECLRRFKRDSRRYAKRQFIWFRKETDFLWMRIEEREQIFALVERFLSQA